MIEEGEVPERTNGAVLKTVGGNTPVGSNPTLAAWAAGIVDGDGSVSMVPSGSLFRKPIVVVDSTDYEILEELQNNFGGHIVLKKSAKPHHRQAWSWRIYGAYKVSDFLSTVLPYMRCDSKRTRACMLINEYPKLTPRNGYYTDDAREAKFAFEEAFFSIGHGRGASLRHKRNPPLEGEPDRRTGAPC